MSRDFVDMKPLLREGLLSFLGLVVAGWAISLSAISAIRPRFGEIGSGALRSFELEIRRQPRVG